MSTVTIEGVDARGYLAGWLQAVTGMTIADMVAIPDDKWNQPWGGCTRPANALMADMVTNLKWTTQLLQGAEQNAYNSMSELATQYSDKHAAIAGLQDASAAFATALTAASDELLNSTAMAPWQMPTPVYTLALISVSHIWYHDGQLNYIQCMLGDEKVHWIAPAA